MTQTAEVLPTVVASQDLPLKTLRNKLFGIWGYFPPLLAFKALPQIKPLLHRRGYRQQCVHFHIQPLAQSL